MCKVTYQLKDGTSKTVEGETGQSLMQLAVNNNIDGIVGRCGGFCNCGTCHVYVEPSWLPLLSDIEFDQDMMLDGTPAERRGNSRLSCQIKLSDSLDGIVVTIPERQE